MMGRARSSPLAALASAAPHVLRDLRACSLARHARRGLAAALVLLLAACAGEGDLASLQAEVDAIINRPPGEVEPIPQFVSYQPFTYSAASLRSPFEPPVDESALQAPPPGEEVKPDENRPREALEAFALGNLMMVGTLERNGVVWALVRDEQGRVHRVGVGNYLGRNHGRIVSISETQIELLEIVPNGVGGWIERPASIVLAGQN